MMNATSLRGISVRSLYQATALALLLAVLATVGALAYLRYQAVERVRASTEGLTKSIDQTIDGLVDRIDYALQISADEIGHQIEEKRPTRSSVTQFLARQQKRLPDIDLLRATNADGEAIYGVGVPATPASLAHRDYFKRLRDDPDAGLVISEPVIGKISQRWIWLMARRINNPDGSFAGVVYGSVFVDELVRMFQQIQLPRDSVIVLRDGNLGLIARSTTGTPQAITPGDRRVSNEFHAALAKSPDEGWFQSGISTPDGVQRIYSYRVNKQHGFIVLVGIPAAKAMGEWQGTAFFAAILLLAGGTAAVVFVLALGRAWQRQHDDMLALEQSHDQLRVAKERAEEATLAKSAFLANMSHEIRTPLNAISGMAHLIRGEPLSVKQSDRLNKMEIATRHLTATINDILDLSKIEANQLILENEKLNLEDVISNVAELIQDGVRNKSLQLDIEANGLPARVRGDMTRLSQALLNYASNAVKFTSTGSIALRARVLHEEDGFVVVHFEVQDSGIGIAPEQLKQLFAPFTQADSSTTRKYGGSGLGLAITKRLVEAMGGEVGAQSEPGRGSTFWFTARLQCYEGGNTAPAPLSEEDEAEAVKMALLRLNKPTPLSLLLAEDDAFNQEIALLQLEELGFQVDVADHGGLAVEKASLRTYALILMDMQMPVLDGVEATRQIRALPVGATVPIIAMTANAFAEDRERCLAAGMNDFVTKPVEPDVLYRVLLAQLRRPA